MVEINIKLYCPDCKQEVVFDHTDDVEQKWYKCKNNHQTTKPIPEKLYCPTCQRTTYTDHGKYTCPNKHTTETAWTEKEVDAFIKGQALQIKENQSIIKAKDLYIEQLTGETKDGQKLSQADRLVRMFLNEKFTLFFDQHQTPYARIELPPYDDTHDDMTIHDGYDGIFAELNSTGMTIYDDIPSAASPQVNTNNTTNPEEQNLCNNREISSYPSYTVIEKPLRRMVNYKLNHRNFKTYLSTLMYSLEEKVPNNESLNATINLISGKCLNEGKQHFLFNRVAPGKDGSIWIDMTDQNWRAIQIKAGAWKIENEPPILFKRYSHQTPLTEPIRLPEEKQNEYALKLLDYINIPSNDPNTKLAFMCSVISCFIPNISHPIIVLHGPQGTAKSTVFKLIKRLVDPSSLELLSLPKDERELVQQLDHHWFAPYDNLTAMPTWASDTFCKAVTGGGLSIRKLYSNDDDMIYNFKRCVGLNGINPAARRGDLLDRTILIGLEPIPNEQKKTDQEIDEAFNKDKPYIFGGILGVLSKALTIYQTLEVKGGYQRLADFNKYGCAIAQALGYTQEDFIKAYAEKVESQNEEAINANPVSIAIYNFCKERIKSKVWLQPESALVSGGKVHKWETNPTEFYNQLTSFAQATGQTDSKIKSNWPKAPNSFMRILNEIKPNLAKEGCIINVNRDMVSRTVTVNASDMAEKLKLNDPEPVKPAFKFKQIPPAEVCNYCGQSAVEYEVLTPSKEKQRRCEGCFRKLGKDFQGVPFVPEEGV